jgi:hypothetical protein
MVWTSACTRQLAPAPIPGAVMPAVRVEARVDVNVGVTGSATGSATGSVTGSGTVSTAPMTGRLIVDVPEGSVPVYRARLEARKQDNGTLRPTFRFFDLPPEKICDGTPCVIDEPPGNILIGFPVLGCRPAIDFDLVHVGLDPSVYRRSLAIFEDDTGAERIVGIVAASLGAAATITGIVLLPSGISKDNSSLTAAGGITLGAGALALTVGILMIRHDSATYRPGSANHFEATGITSGATLTVSPSARSPLEQYPYYECSWGSRRGGTG